MAQVARLFLPVADKIFRWILSLGQISSNAETKNIHLKMLSATGRTSLRTQFLSSPCESNLLVMRHQWTYVWPLKWNGPRVSRGWNFEKAKNHWENACGLGQYSFNLTKIQTWQKVTWPKNHGAHGHTPRFHCIWIKYGYIFNDHSGYFPIFLCDLINLIVKKVKLLRRFEKMIWLKVHSTLT